MRLEIIIPDSALTPARKSKYSKLARRLESQPDFIDAIPISEGKGARKDKTAGVAPITEEELAELDRTCPALRALDEVTDEQWEGVLHSGKLLSREGFVHRV